MFQVVLSRLVYLSWEDRWATHQGQTITALQFVASAEPRNMHPSSNRITPDRTEGIDACQQRLQVMPAGECQEKWRLWKQ
jgi:hypothetical protein